MTLVPDGVHIAPRTIAKVEPVVLRHIPDATVTNDEINCFDADVLVLHGTDRIVTLEMARAIARELRGGHDVDRSKPTDWHVRQFGPEIATNSQTGVDDPPRIIGTRFWLSHSYAVPIDYENDATS